MGLNFYGNLYKKLGEGGPIIGHEYLDILDRDRPPLHWYECSHCYVVSVGPHHLAGHSAACIRAPGTLSSSLIKSTLFKNPHKCEIMRLLSMLSLRDVSGRACQERGT